MPVNLRECKPECFDCIREYIKKHKLSKGDKFEIPCNGIPKEYISEEILSQYSDPDIALSCYDPVLWAAKYLDWHCLDPDGSIWKRKTAEGKLESQFPPYDKEIALVGKSPFHRPYQSRMLQCRSHRKLCLLGRQTGKSTVLVISALHGMFTNENFKIILLAPFQSQVDMFFSKIPELLERNPELFNSIKRKVSAPHPTIELYNGSYLKGFSAGTKSKGEAGSVRGQPAHRLILDECDYLSSEDINAVAAVITNFPEADVWMSSTPTGRRENFYNTFHGKIYKSFYFPSTANPMWSNELESYFRSQLTELGYQREIEAKFGEQEEGVYQNRYIDMCKDNYEYLQMKPDPRWAYSFGVDWNDTKIGTVIIVTGYNPLNSLYYVVDKHIVSRDGWTQTAAIQKIIDLNRIWRPAFIYVDAGYGHCVGPETIIYMENRACYIKDIKQGDMVLTENGTFSKVKSLIEAPKKKSFKLKPSKCISTIISEDHPFLTYRTDNRFKDNSFNEDKLKWRTIKEIDIEKDFIAISKRKVQKKENKIIDILDFLENKSTLDWDNDYVWSLYSNDPHCEYSLNKLAKKYNCGSATITRLKRKIKNNIKLTKYQEDIIDRIKKDYGEDFFLKEKDVLKIRRFFDLADSDFQLVVGWFLSEGNINKATIEFSQKNRLDKFDLVIDAAKRLFPSIGIYVKSNGIKRLFVNSSIISAFFEKLCGKYSDGKYIHPLFNGLDWKYLIQGIIYGDGHLTKNIDGIQLSMTSFHLIMTLRQYFIDRDILPSLYFCGKKKAHHKDRIRIDIQGDIEIIDKLNEITGIKFENKGRVCRRKYITTDNYILVSIDKIKENGERDDLLDIEVEDIHSFHGNGFIIHNCQHEILHGFGFDAMKRAETSGPMNNDARLAKIVKKYDFGSSIEIRDIFTKQPVKKPAKAFLVENAVRKFERNELRFPKSDKKMIDSLGAYVIKNVSIDGTPRYTTLNEQVGDHLVDALNLSLIGYTLEGSILGKPKYTTDIAFSGQFGEGIKPPKEDNPSRNLEKEEEHKSRTEYIGSPSVFGSRHSSKRIWSWPGFLRDEPPLKSRRSAGSRTLTQRPQRKNI